MASGSTLRGLTVLLVSAGFACSESTGPALGPSDATSVDASSTDASVQPDSGRASDAAAMVDAAGPPDADVPMDAGAPTDAPDAGPLDSGIHDTGASDPADAGADAGPQMMAHTLAVTIDRDIDTAPTPINTLYVDEISQTSAGDHIASYQKYWKNPSIITALVDAARRGVTVTTVYRDEVEPSCESLLEPGDTVDCDVIFESSGESHHKNMMIWKTDGTVRGIIGSYNPRVRSSSSPRVHTVLSFTVDQGRPLFDYYLAETERLTGGTTTQPPTFQVPVTGGGSLDFTFHPGMANPALDLLNQVTSCAGPLWMSYFGALADSIGRPVFDRLAALNDMGCDVRVLLDPDNQLGRLSLVGRGVDARFPTFTTGGGTLGHKVIVVESNGETLYMQSSANLQSIHFTLQHNLTVVARVPTHPLGAELAAEFARYW